MRRYLAILIAFIAVVNFASGYSPGDIEWRSAASGTLNKGGTLTAGEFMVKAVQFPAPVQGVKDINGNIIPETQVEPFVSINIYKNGVLIKENLIMSMQSGDYIDPDYEVKVSATGFPAKNARGWVYEYYAVEPPYAAISMQLRATPKLEVTVTTDKSAYTSYNDQIITATATVKNSGGARIKNVDVNLNTGELKLRGGDTSQLHQYYYTLEKGASQTFSVILVVPELIDQKSYTLSADGKGFDVKDLEYKAAPGSSSVTVSPKQNYFTISKAVSKDRMYLQETILVRITVANGGMYDAYNLHVTDSKSENFELKSNTSFQWDIPVLKPGKWEEFTYSIKPLETNLNGFTLPAATAQFTVNSKQYTATSNTPKIIVNGPKIVLNKSVDKPVVNISEDVTVTLSINNVGNIATKAEVKDSLPDGIDLVGGQTSIPQMYLELNTPNKTNYTIRINKEGEFQLPAAIANYTSVEYRGITKAVLSSERPVITVIAPSRITPAPAPTLTENPAPAPQETTAPPEETEESFSQKIIRALKKLIPQENSENPSPTATPEPTPTPITPGFDIVFAVIVLIFAAVHRRR